MATINLTRHIDATTVTAAAFNNNYTLVEAAINGGLDTTNLSTKYAPVVFNFYQDSIAATNTKTVDMILETGHDFIPTHVSAHAQARSSGVLQIHLHKVVGASVTDLFVNATDLQLNSTDAESTTNFIGSPTVSGGQTLQVEFDASDATWSGGQITVKVQGKMLVRT